jgi:hypothetical protein
MNPLRRSFRVAHAWILAVLTLAGGLPHRQCVCPDGKVKWFCVRPADEACCNSACCAAGRDARDAPPAAARSCCSHQPQRPARGRMVQATPCRKTWVPSSVVVDKPTREAGPAKNTQEPSLLAAIPTDTGAVPDGVCERGRPANRAPPPSDPLILFQRLLL